MGVKLAAASGGSIELVPTNTASNFTVTVPAGTATVAIDGPAFSAYQSSSQSVTTATYTKVQLQTELFDTNSCFDSTTNYRFTPTVAGYYQFNWRVGCNNGSGEVLTAIYKNGSTANFGLDIAAATYGTGGATILYTNGSTDYFELYFYQASGSSKNTTALATETWFNGAMVRAA